MNCAKPIIFVVGVTVVSWSAVGCGGGTKEGTGAKGPGLEGLPLTIDHEPCDVTSSSAENLDTNGDGKPDIVRVMSGGREVCRMVDLNHDGKPDAFIYFDANGNIRRRESDFDRDGRIDEIAYYTAGVVTRKDRETNLDGKLDTWDFYEGGKIHHRMRDSDGDGKVDQWWTWPNPDKIECAVIASDHNGDGKPDPNDVIDVCAVAAAAPSPSFGAGGDGGAPVGPSGASAGFAVDGGTKLAASTQGAAAAGAAQPPIPVSASTSPDGGASKKTGTAQKKEAK